MKYDYIYDKLKKEVPNYFTSSIDRSSDIIDGEIMSTIVMANLALYFMEMVKTENREEVTKINSFLHSLIEEGNNDIHNIIITGFLEAFQPNDEIYTKYKDELHPKLKIAIEHLDDVLARKKDAPSDWFLE